jgi:hypothetical protein
MAAPSVRAAPGPVDTVKVLRKTSAFLADLWGADKVYKALVCSLRVRAGRVMGAEARGRWCARDRVVHAAGPAICAAR